MYGPTTYGARRFFEYSASNRFSDAGAQLNVLDMSRTQYNCSQLHYRFHSLGQSLPVLTGGVSTLAPTPASDPGSSGLGTGAIIGIIAAGFVFLIAVGLGAYLLVTRKKGQGDHKAPASSSHPNDKSDLFELPVYDTTPKAGGERRTLLSELVVMFAHMFPSLLPCI